jgi:hypothetical protein
MSSERQAPSRAPFVSGPIQVLPAGLLGFLQLKSPAGRNPDVLTGEVQPGLEMLDFYVNQQSIHAVQGGKTIGLGTGSGNQIFDTPSIVVPLDEFWFVRYFTVQMSPLTAGDILQGFAPMAYLDPNAPSARFHLLAQPIYGRPTGGIPVSTAFDFWVPPGTQFGAYIDTYTFAAAEGVVGDMFFARFPI